MHIYNIPFLWINIPEHSYRQWSCLGWGSNYLPPFPWSVTLPPKVNMYIGVNLRCLLRQIPSCYNGINRRGRDHYLGQDHGLHKSIKVFYDYGLILKLKIPQIRFLMYQLVTACIMLRWFFEYTVIQNVFGGMGKKVYVRNLSNIEIHRESIFSLYK